jgi:hypothetical protein
VWYGDKQKTPEGVQTLYHRDNLPYIARQLPSPDTVRFGPPYFGAQQIDGDIWVEYSDEDFDESQAGSPFIDINITNEQARTDTINNGPPGGIDKPVYARDPESPSDSVVIGVQDPRHYMNPNPISQAEWQRDQSIIKNKVSDRMILQLSPEDAAEIAFLDPVEFQARAIELGINPFSGEDLQGRGDDEAPDTSILKDELQVSSTTEETEEKPVETFDHEAAARAGAMGVAKANAADRAAKVAAAQEAAAEASAATSVPRITSPAPKSPVTSTGAPKFQAPDPYTAPDGPTTPRPDPAPVTKPSPTPSPPTTQPTAPRTVPRSGQTRHI